MSIPGRPMPDNNTEYVKEAENTFNVQVRFASRTKLYTSVLVKGCEKEADKVQDAARFLCFHMCGSVSICFFICHIHFTYRIIVIVHYVINFLTRNAY